jgi:MoxR-like ATPase
LSDALRRRCLYHHLDYPTQDREVRIILVRVPGISAALARQVAGMIAALRREELAKVPGVAETLDWARALLGLGVADIAEDSSALFETLACVLKTQEDRARISREVVERLAAKVA